MSLPDSSYSSVSLPQQNWTLYLYTDIWGAFVCVCTKRLFMKGLDRTGLKKDLWRTEICQVVQLGEEKAEGWHFPVSSFLRESSGGGGDDLLSLVTGDRTWGNGVKVCQESLDCTIEKVLHPEGSQSLEQVPQESSHSSKPGRVQGVSGQCS